MPCALLYKKAVGSTHRGICELQATTEDRKNGATMMITDSFRQQWKNRLVNVQGEVRNGTGNMLRFLFPLLMDGVVSRIVNDIEDLDYRNAEGTETKIRPKTTETKT